MPPGGHDGQEVDSRHPIRAGRSGRPLEPRLGHHSADHRGDLRENSPTAYATVQKLLERLETKGCVTRDRSSFAHVFHPAIDRSDLISQGLENLAEQLCGGSLTPLLIHLAGATDLTEQDRKMLRKLIEDAE